MKLRKVNVKNILNQPFVGKQKFIVILIDNSGQFSLDIQIRDSIGRVKEIKTIIFFPNVPIDLLGIFNKLDLIDSIELQMAIDQNILKYVEE